MYSYLVYCIILYTHFLQEKILLLFIQFDPFQLLTRTIQVFLKKKFWQRSWNFCYWYQQKIVKPFRRDDYYSEIPCYCMTTKHIKIRGKDIIIIHLMINHYLNCQWQLIKRILRIIIVFGKSNVIPLLNCIYMFKFELNVLMEMLLIQITLTSFRLNVSLCSSMYEFWRHRRIWVY